MWADFCAYADKEVAHNEVAILVAWNGENCDMKEIWKLAQAPGSTMHLPAKVRYFIDPYQTITKYTGCQLHTNKSKLDSLSLGVVWKYITGENLNGAHDSLVDAKAQMDVILLPSFVPYLNKSESVHFVTEIPSKKEQSELRKSMELQWPVHALWKEQS